MVVVKKFVELVRMSLCKHDFRLMDIEYNRQTAKYGLDNLAYRCPKCGKIVWMRMRGGQHEFTGRD